MAERTHTPDTSNSPRSYGWCSWHDGYAGGVRLIQVHEQGSGAGGNVFACGPCRTAHKLVAFADRPL